MRAVLAGLSLWAGCEPEAGDAHPRFGEELPDFALVDTNATSPTTGTEVSPRQFLGQRTAWYFGHST
ncbi:MAG: hypothetical protein KTR31_11690 [Myxococcales bacterium]|nr:hypothetical protein [Myxococcales bacterium]